MNPEDYKFPVYATQGGGLARVIGGQFAIFVEPPPDFPELQVGSSVPEQWDLQPVNNLAREREREEWPDCC